MIPQTPRHDFLHELHKLLRPATYLEIGVQTGRSLAQAIPPTRCIGIDPNPQISVPITVEHQICAVTSDDFFGTEPLNHRMGWLGAYLDLAFIDGMHLVEYCLRDFMNVERHARPDGRTVAVFDDVLPYSHTIAGREPLPGDWAGDCWKIWPVLLGERPDLTLILVDVAPTGALVVLGLDPGNTDLADRYDDIAEAWTGSHVGEEAFVVRHLHNMRVLASPPDVALNLIRSHLESLA